MANPIIKIPTPCHESWQDMTPLEKGRFCATCCKTVQDFTMSTDIEIAKAYRENKNMCGRFLTSQLDRELIIPKEKSNYWAAASAAVISFLSAGTQIAVAQEKPKVEQYQIELDSVSTKDTLRYISGIVVSEYDTLPLPGTFVKNLSVPGISVSTDIDGKFTINAKPGDILVFQFIGTEDQSKIVDDTDNEILIIMPYNEEEYTGEMIVAGGVRSVSVFRRIWYKITNVFR